MTTPYVNGTPYLNQLTSASGGSSLPKGWQSLPTTDASEQESIQIVAAVYGNSIASKLQSWYDAARKKDPGITPNQAIGIFLVGADISVGLTGPTSVLTGGTVTASNSATGALGSNTNVGVGQAAVGAAASLYATSPGGSSSACALHLPGFSFGPVGWGGWCIISKTNLRAFLGGSLLVTGGLVGIVATVLAVGFAFSETKAGKTAVSAATAIGTPVTAPVRFVQARSRQKAASQEAEASQATRARAVERAEEAHAERIRVSRIRTPEEA